MTKLADPENVVINVVVAIAAFISGGVVGMNRMSDKPPTEFTQTVTRTESGDDPKV
jgi:hypothetical protein